MAKKALGPLLVIFVLFFVLSQPTKAAGAAEVMGDALGAVLTAVSRFLTALLS